MGLVTFGNIIHLVSGFTVLKIINSVEFKMSLKPLKVSNPNT